MTDRPILFSGPMVRAILGGRKMQTRRILKLPTKNIYEHPKMGGWAASTVGGNGCYLDPAMTVPAPERACIWHQTTGITILPPYAPGDRLWVRETWTARMDHGWTIADARSRMYQEEILYKADGHDGIDRWWPSIHMPHEFSRLTLIVTDVRMQRLQEISETDAVAEGVDLNHETGAYWGAPGMGLQGATRQYAHASSAFRDLWDSLNAKRAAGWEANPWVCAVSFTTHQRNIGRPFGETP